MSSSTPLPVTAAPRLRRALKLRDLLFYGIIVVQPTAPMPLFGVAYQETRGHVVTAVLFAMFAMLLTALSYGRMARAYPSAGSAYTYVGRELHPALGFLTGWSLLLDYVLGPVICVIWCSKAAANVISGVPFGVWAIGFALLFTALNLRGIQASARTNQWLTIAMSVVIVWFLAAAVRYVLGLPAIEPQFFTRPFYDPERFSQQALLTGTALAVLTYMGFDGISTLSEEVENPRRNILLATVLTCLVTGILASIEVYAGQLVWPRDKAFPDADTAFVYVAGLAGGATLFQVMNMTLLIASIGSGMGAHLAAARLLYGMGRDNSLPQGFFGAIDSKSNIPRNNVLLTGGVILAGAFLVSYQFGAELLNFGAFIGFMGVNLSVFTHYWLRGRDRGWSYLVLPLAGFFVCFFIWMNLRAPAKIAGAIWLAAGILYAAWRTRGFRKVRMVEAPE